MTGSIGTLFWTLLLISLSAACGFRKYPDKLSFTDFEDQLRSYAVVYGLEKELELIKEAFYRIEHGGIEDFDKTMDPERYAHHKPNPECYMNVTELIAYQGYGFEEYYTVTPDGYVLALQRVLPKSGIPNNSSKVVLLQHGLLDSATAWVINQADNSLGFMLVDAGFDVWLANSRGNKYSHTNIHYKPSRREFWEFSWDEMAKYDLPTLVDFVALNSGVEKIHYVGHSQGTLIAFTGFSQNPELASKIEHFYALAPIATIGDVEGPTKLLAKFHQLFYNALNLFGYEEFLPNNLLDQALGRTLCSLSPLTCEVVTFFIAGNDLLGFNKTRADVYYSHYPAGTSLQNMNHWAQLVESNVTQMYDFGSDRSNENHYGQKTPPLYNVTGLTVPVSLFYGGNDKLADVKDVLALKEQISDVVVYENYIRGFNHLDFVWGISSNRQVYNVIIKQIKNGVKK